jgi:cytochrome c-type biogenesis protein CcmH
MIKWLFMLTLFCCVQAFSAEIYPFADDAQRQRFQNLTQQFRCMVCQNEDLASSNAALAEDLRREIFLQIRQGAEDNAIINYMVKRYGAYVLFRPPLQMQTYLLWLAPGIFLLLGIAILITVVRRATGQRVYTDANS